MLKLNLPFLFVILLNLLSINLFAQKVKVANISIEDVSNKLVIKYMIAIRIKLLPTNF